MIGRVAGFGFVLTLSSAVGQTHFVSLFNADIRGDFGLSHGGVGALYSLATLAAAGFLPWLGRLIDEVDLRAYAAAVTGGLALAACSLAFSQVWWQLALAFFLLRLCGQGLSSHTAMAATARLAAGRRRGRALSLAGLGYSAGEALAPPTVAALLAFLTWREVWLAAAAALLVGVATGSQWLLAGLPHRPPALAQGGDGEGDGSWTRREVVRDWRFWRAAPAVFSPAFIVTALLFHQNSLADFKGADFRVWSSGIAAYSLAAVAMSLGGGALADRFGGARVAKCCLLPLTGASLLPLATDAAVLPFAYYALMGATVGLSLPSVNAMWAEVYGVAHIGAVRALAQALVALFSAAGPVVYGVLLDAGFGWGFILSASAVWLVACAMLFALTPFVKLSPPGGVS